MKRTLLNTIVVVGLVVLFFASVSIAQNIAYSTTSMKKLAASGLVFTGKCFLSGLNLIADGTHDVTVTLYDSATGATGGIVSGPFVLFGGFKSDRLTWPVPLLFKNGIYVVYLGAGGNATIEYAR